MAENDDTDPTVFIHLIPFYVLPIVTNIPRLWREWTLFHFFGFSLLQQYFANRLKYLASEKTNGENPYPHKFSVSISVSEFINKYKSLFNGDHVEDDLVSVAGNDNKILSINFYIKQYIYIFYLCSMFFFCFGYRTDNEQEIFIFQAFILWSEW